MADNPPNPSFEQGKAAMAAGDLNAARTHFRQAVADQPDCFEHRMYHGLVLARLERWADAEREFGEALSIDGGSADAAYFQGVAIAKQGRLREAHGMFAVALGNDPNHQRAKEAHERTAAAAAEVTKEGSSVAMPGGLSGIDISNVDLLEGGTTRTASGSGMPSEVSDALAEMGGQQRGARPAPQRTGPTIKTTKKSGCLGLVGLMGLVALALLLVLF